MYTWIPNEGRHLSRYSKRSILVQPFSTLRIVVFKIMIDRYISVDIATALLVARALYKFAERQKQERGCLSG